MQLSETGSGQTQSETHTHKRVDEEMASEKADSNEKNGQRIEFLFVYLCLVLSLSLCVYIVYNWSANCFEKLPQKKVNAEKNFSQNLN